MSTGVRPAKAPRRSVLATLGLVVFGMVAGVTIGVALSHGSDLVRIDKDVVGVVVSVTPDGSHLVIDTGGHTLTVDVLNPNDRVLKPGDVVEGTLVFQKVKGQPERRRFIVSPSRG